jgi:hypothetical protein
MRILKADSEFRIHFRTRYLQKSTQSEYWYMIVESRFNEIIPGDHILKDRHADNNSWNCRAEAMEFYSRESKKKLGCKSMQRSSTVACAGKRAAAARSPASNQLSSGAAQQRYHHLLAQHWAGPFREIGHIVGTRPVTCRLAVPGDRTGPAQKVHNINFGNNEDRLAIPAMLVSSPLFDPVMQCNIHTLSRHDI